MSLDLRVNVISVNYKKFISGIVIAFSLVYLRFSCILPTNTAGIKSLTKSKYWAKLVSKAFADHLHFCLYYVCQTGTLTDRSKD